jgi:hypothetical protein
LCGWGWSPAVGGAVDLCGAGGKGRGKGRESALEKIKSQPASAALASIYKDRCWLEAGPLKTFAVLRGVMVFVRIQKRDRPRKSARI